MSRRCACGCGEWVDHRGRYALAACRQRAYRARERERRRPSLGQRGRWLARLEGLLASSEGEGEGPVSLEVAPAELRELLELLRTGHDGQAALPL